MMIWLKDGRLCLYIFKSVDWVLSGREFEGMASVGKHSVWSLGMGCALELDYT